MSSYLQCLLNNKIADIVWNQFTNRYYQHCKFKIIALSPTQNWETTSEEEDDHDKEARRLGFRDKQVHGCGGGLVAKLYKIVWQRVHTALFNLVCEYDFDLDNVWIVDSGTSDHIVKNKNLLRNPVRCRPGSIFGQGLSGKKSEVTHIGDAYLPIKINKREGSIRLRGVQYNPEVFANLLSVHRLTRDFPYSIEFYDDEFIMRNIKTKKVIVKGPQIGNYYFWPSPEIDAWITKATDPERKLKASTVIIVLVKVLVKVVSNHASNLAATFFACLNNFVELMFIISYVFHALIFGDDEVPECYEVNNSWCVDTGCPGHLTCNENLLQNLSNGGKKLFIRDALGRRVAQTHHGVVHLKSPSHGVTFVLEDVPLLPESNCNLLSVLQMTCDYSCSFKFGSSGFVVKCVEKNKVLAKGTKRHKYYYWC